MSNWNRRDTLIVLGVVALAAVIRFPGLSEPRSLVFDETYYAKDSCLYGGMSQEFCNAPQPTEQSFVHPPAGKWLIAGGIRAFGYTSFGWRVSAAVFGTALVPLVYLLARKLFSERWVAGVAGFLVATDFLLIVQSRIAMLDIFLAFFVVLGFLFLAYDRDRLHRWEAHLSQPFPGEPPPREPEWRLAAGAAFGLALATKWSALLALGGAGLMAIIWALRLARRHRRPTLPEPRKVLVNEVGLAVLALGLVPLLVYLLSYSLWFVEHLPFECGPADPPTCQEGVVATAQEFLKLQRNVLDYHTTLEATHNYQAEAWTWPLVIRPIAYYYTAPPDTDKSHHILALGNPATWWAALPAGVWLAWRGRRRWGPERFVLAAWLIQYLPWLFVGRVIFFYYMTPIVPFMMIGLAGGLGAMRNRFRGSRWLVGAYLAIGVGLLLAYFYPVLVGAGLEYPLWRSRMWFDSWI